MSDTKTITIQGREYNVATPFVAGHVITDGEAKALNQTRLENIRNNVAAKAKKLLGEAEALTAEQITELDAYVAEYDAAYVFTLATVSAGRKTVDPVEAEARRMAKSVIAAKVTAAGKTLKSLDKEKLETAIANLAASENIMKAARKVVKERSQNAEADLGDLGI